MKDSQDKKFLHEVVYRGAETFQKMRESHLTIAGVGTLGSQLAVTLTRQGFASLRLIDMDRVEEQNLGTQIYGTDDIGALKVDSARNIIFRNVEVEPETINKRLTEQNIQRLLKKTDLVIDAFDNHDSRLLISNFCKSNEIPCLHLGLHEDYGEVVWNEVYRVPKDVDGDVCDYPMARNLAMLVVSIAAEEVIDFVCQNSPRMQSHCVTLKDLTISQYC